VFYATSVPYRGLDGTKYGKEKEQEKERHVETWPGRYDALSHHFFLHDPCNRIFLIIDKYSMRGTYCSQVKSGSFK
jgi:hypothetical protein